MKRLFQILFILPCLIWGVNVHGQNLFREYLEVLSSNQIDEEELKGKLASSMVKLKMQQGVSEAEATKQFEAYYANKFKPQLCDCMEQHYRKYLTEGDLLQLIKQMTSPGYQLALTHLNGIDQEKQMEPMLEAMLSSLFEVLQGEAGSPMPAPKVSASYKQKFDTMYGNFGISAAIDQMFQLMASQMGSQDQAIRNRLQSWFNKNGKTMAMHLYCGAVTEADLDAMNEVYSSPQGMKLKQANATILPEIMNLTKKSMSEFLRNA